MLSLLISCTGWTTRQLMAFSCDKLSPLTASTSPGPRRPSLHTHANLTHRGGVMELHTPHPSFLCLTLGYSSHFPPAWPSISIHAEETQTDSAKLRATQTCVNSDVTRPAQRLNGSASKCHPSVLRNSTPQHCNAVLCFIYCPVVFI